MNTYTTKEQVHNRGIEAIGKSLAEISAVMNVKTSGKKSKAGDAWESWFGVEKNSIAGADLAEAGVELKATAIINTTKGKTAKERLVLNIINYIEEYDKDFASSSFWNKNKYMELGLYGYEKDTPWTEWTILKSVLYSFPEKDLLIIKQDWEKIHKYIQEGRAHELSEGMTMYLGACTKGKNSSSTRKQHPSLNAPDAMQRAYSLKNKYMTAIVREIIFANKEIPGIRTTPFLDGEILETNPNIFTEEQIISDPSILKEVTFETYIINRLNEYKDMTVSSLAKIFKISAKDNGKFPKSINSMLASRMLGIKGDLEKTEEFFKANIEVKTIRIKKNGTIAEDMSFPTFKFKDLVKEEWVNSTLRTEFDSSKYLFVVFVELEDGNYKYVGSKFWTMPERDLETVVKYAWLKTKKTLIEGVELFYDTKKNIVKNNFLKSSDDEIIHIRPHAAKASYIAYNPNANQLPNTAKWINKPKNYSDDWMTKQCFWLNKKYVKDQIKDLL